MYSERLSFEMHTRVHNKDTWRTLDVPQSVFEPLRRVVSTSKLLKYVFSLIYRPLRVLRVSLLANE